MEDLLAALALVMVFEGLLPAISPRLYRKAMFTIMQRDERTLRTIGIATMVSGALFLYLVRH
jgi:hypothetical protein